MNSRMKEINYRIEMESNKSTMMKDTLVETTDKQLKEIGIDWEEAECPRQEEK